MVCISSLSKNLQSAGWKLTSSPPVADGTPRDCSSNRCGSQADTSIIRDSEIRSGEVGPLGRTQGNGPVDAAVMIQNFLGTAAAPTNNGSADSVGVEDDLDALNSAREERREVRKRQLSRLFDGLLGGNGAEDSGEKNEFAAESVVGDTAGTGATSGLPTSSDEGEVKLVLRQVRFPIEFHDEVQVLTSVQINQDGAGPMKADIDAISGGTEASAFETAEVKTDVPGFVAGLSLATNTDFPITVQMPAGMTCEGSVGGADNVCIVRVRNSTPAGPFGGSAAFTQSAGARKRAIAYRLRKRMEIGR